MFYLASLVVSTQGGQQKASFLTDQESDSVARAKLQELWFVLLSLQTYTLPPEQFWVVKATLTGPNGSIDVIVDKQKVRDAYKYLAVDIAMNVTYINSLANPLPDEKVALILTKLQKEFLQIEEVAVIKRKDLDQLSQKDLDNFRAILNETIRDAQELLENSATILSPIRIKDLRENLDDLIKIKNSTNIEKLSLTFQALIASMEEIELLYNEELKKKESDSVSEFVISNLDIFKEYDKYKKSHKKSSVIKISWVGKNTMSLDDNMYVFLWKPWLYMKLLSKEIHLRFIQQDSIAKHFAHYLELLFLVCLLELTFFYLYNVFAWTLDPYFYMLIWNVGLIWFLQFFAKYLISKSIISFLLWTIVMVAVFLWLRYFIIVNFAL